MYDKGVIIDARKKLERALQEKMVAYHFIYGRQKCLSSIYRKMLRYYSAYYTTELKDEENEHTMANDKIQIY